MGIAKAKSGASDHPIKTVRPLFTNVACLVIGTMISALPHYAGAWTLAALVAPYLLTYAWPDASKGWRWASAIATAAAVFGCGAMAVRAYLGANYHLKYKVCGGAVQSFGLTRAVFIGVEMINENGQVLYGKVNSVTFTADDRSSTMTVLPDIIPLTAVGYGDNGRLFSHIEYDPPIENPKEVMRGKLRYMIKFGFKKDDPDRTLLIDGKYTMGFAEEAGVNGTDFRFSPSSETSEWYAGGCDPRKFNQELSQ